MSPAPAWTNKGPRIVPLRVSPGDPVRDLSPTFACFIAGARAAIAVDNFNPYRSLEHATAGGFEGQASAWDRGHAWAVQRMKERPCH